MRRLALHLLGAFEATLDGKPITGIKTEKARALLAYLAVERGRGHRRQSLVGLLWPDYPESSARANLRQVLTNLRQVLKDEENPTPFILVEGETIQFNPESDFWLDVTAFEEQISAKQEVGKTIPSVDDLKGTISLYRGGLLEGFSLKDSPDFDSWTANLRERYQGMASSALGKLGEHHEQSQDYEKAIGYARRRLELEPWQEEAHRQLMRLLAINNQRSAALAQFEACKRILKDELGVEPSAETIRLHMSIRDGNFTATAQEKPRQHNLPAQLTSFIGRDKEIEQVLGLIKTHRLVSLTGSGGTGKTRLALQVAERSIENFPDGVWLAELAPLSDPTLVVEAAAQALGMQLASNPQALSFLQDYLESRHLLLILDNCEHLIEACARLADALLHTCPRLSILATSREALGIDGEASYLVPQLTLPGTGELPPLETLLQYEAVRLFIERAGNASSDFMLTSDNAPAIIQVCQRLDGMPLALELAAARVKVLRVEEIAARLDDRFRLLTGGSRAALPRYQTLRASIDWSYALLSSAEQRLLQCLSVFAGSWTLEAAEFTGCGEDIGSSTVLDLLGSLVNKSLVAIETETGPTTRYRMLETIRQYAHEKLEDAGQATAARDRNLLYYVELAEKVEGKVRGPDQVVIMDQLEAESDNLRQALEWSMETRNPEMGLRLASAVHWFWHSRNWHVEGVNWIERLLASQAKMHENSPLSHPQLVIRAKALGAAGALAQVIDRTARYLEEGAALCQELGSDVKRDYAYILRSLGGLFLGVEDRSRFNSLLEESIALFLEVGDRFGYCESRDLLAMQAILEHEFEKARLMLEENLTIRKELGDQEGIAWELILLGGTALGQCDFEKARPFIEESLSINSRINCIVGIDMALLHIGLIDWLQGKYEQASRNFEKLLFESRRQGALYYIFIGFSALGRLALSQGNFDHATRLMEECLAFTWKKDHIPFMMDSLCDLGSLALAKGEFGQAAQKFSHVLELNQEIGEQTVGFNAIYGLGKVDCDRGGLLSARRHFFEAIEKRWGTEWPFSDWSAWNAALPLEALGLLAVSLREMEHAARLLGATEEYHQCYQNARTPRERAERESAILEVRDALGEDAFKKTWEEGQTLSINQAIEYARQETTS